jgi:hypothetical protein
MPSALMTPGLGRIFVFLAGLFLIALPCGAAAPGDAEDAGAKKESSEAAPKPPEPVHAIPYPNGAIYVNRGICGAFMFGKHRNLGEDQSLFQWQGELSYFYTPSISGGVAFKITAGEPSSLEQKIYNRYFAHLRFHKAWEKLALYVGPQVGVGNLNLLSDTVSDSSKSSIKNNPINSGPLKIGNTKPTLGLDLGGGWMFSRYVGFTLANHLEYSLVDEEGVGVTNALNLHINPGISVDILAFTDSLRDLVSGMYISAELQGGLLIFEKANRRQDQAAVLGIGLAF